MRIRKPILRVLPIFLSCGLLLMAHTPYAWGASPVPSKSNAPSAANTTSQFRIAEQTQIPGQTLTPGLYSIHIVDQLTDRVVLQIDSVSGNTHTLFLGLPDHTQPSTASGVIPWTSGSEGKTALRGFAFKNGTTVEFVYPKAEAVSLAKANDQKIPAIDPESEGRQPAASLSKRDMQLVTLWLLSTTRVGPGESGPGIKAERYQQVASVHPPRPAIRALPHTASYLPIVWSLGLLSFAAAGMLRLRRFTAK